VDKTIDLRQQIKPVQKSESNAKPEIISWEGFLYRHDPDMKAVWFAACFFFALAIVVQIFQKNIITTTLMALIGLMILFQAKRKHDNVGEIALSPLGVKVGEINYPYPEIRSFWVDYQPESGIEELSLQLKKWYMPYIRIPMDGHDPVRIRGFLIKYIPEVQHETSLGEAVSRRLGL